MSDYQTTVVQDGSTVRFSFASPEGPVRVLTIAVVDLANNRFLWQLSRIVGLGRADPGLSGRAEAKAARADVSREELRGFVARMYGSSGNMIIDQVVYGVVPEGSKQDVPAAGRGFASAAQPGR